MRRLSSLALFGSIAFASSLASAQDAQPVPTVSTSATVTTPPPPPTVVVAPVAPVAPVVVAVPVEPVVSEQEPLRLGRLIQSDADRARAARYGTNAVQIILGATEVISSAVLVSVVNQDTSGLTSDEQGLFTAFGVVGMVFGGLEAVGGLISLFIETPTERMFDEYAPIAIDKHLSPAERVRRGEIMLAARSESEHRLRITNATTSFIGAAVLVGFGLVLAFDNDLLQTDDGTRALLALSVGVGGIAGVMSGVGSLVWERGTAEIAWEHWKAMHENVVVQTSQIHLTPLLAPTRGGAMAGFSLRF